MTFPKKDVWALVWSDEFEGDRIDPCKWDFEMGNGFAYSSYRINITKNKGDDTLMQVAEFELIGPVLP